MTRAGIISQARMTSTRLPGKVLMPANGRPLLQYHLNRLAQSELPVYVATTINESDDPIVAFCEQRNVPFYRGDEHNVLGRFYETARAFDLDTIIRVTSDCPLIDAKIIKSGLGIFQERKDSRIYLTNAIARSFPRGMDFEIFSFEALEEAYWQAWNPAQREHVTPYFYQGRPESFPRVDFLNEEDASRFRLTVDMPEDYELIKRLIEEYACETKDCKEIVACLRSHPDLAKLNEHIEQKKL